MACFATWLIDCCSTSSEKHFNYIHGDDMYMSTSSNKLVLGKKEIWVVCLPHDWMILLINVTWTVLQLDSLWQYSCNLANNKTCRWKIDCRIGIRIYILFSTRLNWVVFRLYISAIENQKGNFFFHHNIVYSKSPVYNNLNGPGVNIKGPCFT
jgi:hypothetical protein